MPDLPGEAADQTKFFGKFKGVVVDNTDPLKKGRLKVTAPAALDSVEVWAMPCVPYAGPQMGFYTMPEPGTGVWVEFERGDLSYPVWSGFFWSDGDIDSADTDPNIKFFKTKKFTFRIDDSNGEVTIENDSGSLIKLTAQDILVKSSSVNQEASGGRKTELSAASFKVNDGSMEVL